MYLSFAWRYFKAKKSANAINIIAWVTTAVIAFATLCQVLVLSVFNGFEGLVKSLYSSFYSDLKIGPAKGKTILLTPERLETLKSVPGIAAISLVAEEKALLQNDDAQTVVLLKGVDAAYSQVSGVPDNMRQGKFNTGTPDDPGLIVGAGVQDAANISMDAALPSTNLTLILPKKDSTAFADPLQSISEGNTTATGIFSIQQDFDSRYAFTNLTFVKQQTSMGSDEYSAAEIRIQKGSDEKKISGQLKAILGNNYLIQSKYEQNTTLYNTMKLEKWAIFGVLTLILIIAAFNMISALTMLVLEKKKDISVLQSLGASKGMIYKIFLSEGLLLGVIGTGIGIAAGLLICWLQIKTKFIELEGGTFLINYFPVKIIASDFLLVAGTALAIVLAASWLPSRKAANQPFELR
jgi:lipoprotein-releasing system permease protein